MSVPSKRQSVPENGSVIDTPLVFRSGVEKEYADIFTPEVKKALTALARFDRDRREVMDARLERRAERARKRERIGFLEPDGVIPRTHISVADAREGNFIGGEIPSGPRAAVDPGNGPAAKPDAPLENSIRNVAYALLSGADGWMFDGEDALGQISTMSLDNQRNLKLAIARDPVFLNVAERVAAEMNEWARGFFGREIVDDWKQQLDFTTKIFRARGLHLDDRHVRLADGTAGFSASIVDTVLYVVNNHTSDSAAQAPRSFSTSRRSRPPRKPPLWNDIITALENHLGLPVGSDQGVRPGGAARGQLPTDGDPGRARPALRRLQHRAVGLHQQRVRRDGVGSTTSTTPTSTPSQ